jgi:diguanylate cyclase (GGDEF)-like protein/PAS domain S-box-containing protein
MADKQKSHSHRARAAVQREQERAQALEPALRLLADHSTDLVLILDPCLAVRYISPSAQRVVGYHPDELDGRCLDTLVSLDDIGEVRRYFADLAARPIGSHRLTFRMRHKDGSLRVVEGAALRDGASPGGRFVLHAREVAGDASADPYRALVEKMPAATYVRRIGETAELVYASPQMETLLGPATTQTAAAADRWLAQIHSADRERVAAIMARATELGEPVDMEYRITAADGRVLWVRDMAVMREVQSDGGQLWQGIQLDITADKIAEEQLHRLAFYDALTDLPNRRKCIDQLERALGDATRATVALLFLDLDRFKVINDGIGHAAGDELLIAVARRLAPHVAGHGSLARFGGDEFVAVLERMNDVGKIEAVAANMLQALRDPFRIKGYELIVEGTIGIAIASPALTTPDDLLRAADVALYRAKERGGDTFAVFDPEIDQGGLERLEQQEELRRALERGEFAIAYQPVVDIGSRQILAVEALIRWNHPQRGVLSPSSFLPLAEETGIIVPLGRWVIEEACRQARQWQTRYPDLGSLQVSVNLSSRQVRHASLAQDVAEALARAGLAPEHLALELKEGDALANSATVAATLKELKRLGVRVTFDDFGKGWAALSSLTQFSVDDLKIDGSYIARLGESPQEIDVDIVRALVTMAKAIGLDVTAEAVETSEQWATLAALGCDRVQGRHFAPPLSVAEMEALLAHGSTASAKAARLPRSP